MKIGDMVRERGYPGELGVIISQRGTVPYLPNRFFTVLFSRGETRTVTEILLEVIS